MFTGEQQVHVYQTQVFWRAHVSHEGPRALAFVNSMRGSLRRKRIIWKKETTSYKLALHVGSTIEPRSIDEM
jgi:hypothetical protein